PARPPPPASRPSTPPPRAAPPPRPPATTQPPASGASPWPPLARNPGLALGQVQGSPGVPAWFRCLTSGLDDTPTITAASSPYWPFSAPRGDLQAAGAQLRTPAGKWKEQHEIRTPMGDPDPDRCYGIGGTRFAGSLLAGTRASAETVSSPEPRQLPAIVSPSRLAPNVGIQGQLLFTKTTAGDIQTIYTMSGHGDRRLTAPGDFSCLLRISPDSQRLLAIP